MPLCLWLNAHFIVGGGRGGGGELPFRRVLYEGVIVSPDKALCLLFKIEKITCQSLNFQA